MNIWTRLFRKMTLCHGEIPQDYYNCPLAEKIYRWLFRESKDTRIRYPNMVFISICLVITMEFCFRKQNIKLYLLGIVVAYLLVKNYVSSKQLRRFIGVVITQSLVVIFLLQIPLILKGIMLFSCMLTAFGFGAKESSSKLAKSYTITCERLIVLKHMFTITCVWTAVIVIRGLITFSCFFTVIDMVFIYETIRQLYRGSQIFRPTKSVEKLETFHATLLGFKNPFRSYYFEKDLERNRYSLIILEGILNRRLEPMECRNYLDCSVIENPLQKALLGTVTIKVKTKDPTIKDMSIPMNWDDAEKFRRLLFEYGNLDLNGFKENGGHTIAM